jgi:hypothetical protein
MAEPDKMTATPFLLLEGEDKGHLETVSFIAHFRTRDAKMVVGERG